MTFSAVISCSETAFFSLSPKDIESLRKDNSRRSQTVLKLLGMQDYLLATILIVNNLVNICAVIIANSIMDSVVTFESTVLEFIIKVVAVTFILLLFGEIMPKIYANYRALSVSRNVSLILLFLKKIFYPFSYVVIHTSDFINAKLSVKKVNISMDEISNAIEMTTDQTDEEKKILSGIVNFMSTEVEEIMRPRVDVVALDEDTGFEDVCKTVIDSGYSRIPVYREKMDNIIGILYVKDLLPYLDKKDDFDWKKLCRKPYFVPEHKKINDLFTEFQENKIHIAIVVDEYGSTLGLVSLEDVLEEIVGEISDESDTKHSYYTQIDTKTYIFEGRTHLIDFLKIIDFDDDYLDEYKGEAESLAGLMLERKHDFLKVGDKLFFKDLSLRVESVDGLRIDKIKVKIHKPE
ncbi:MAG: gliding motility-associated protein GldE [Rikenellaceae bacterium]|nr:gliding motility-associated protein GldE [Rikenellaceae bacterium]